MACGVALKRPYECEEYLAEGVADAKRARTTVAHCSPFRPQLGTVAASLSFTMGSSALLQVQDNKDRDENDTSPFSSISGRNQLSPAQLESYLRAEIRYLKRRNLLPKHKELSATTSGQSVLANGAMSASMLPQDPSISKQSYRAPPKSPNANSGSESESENSPTTSKEQIGSVASVYEKPQFSLKQVQMICERLLKQQEVRLRYEYETVLNQRLDEQHEQYVQFAKEQLERQSSDSTDLSYLS
uniref:Akirin n=1 Tax=Syphacia muris TaxID=451379 RepID=A0A0N5AX16_9BILA